MRKLVVDESQLAVAVVFGGRLNFKVYIFIYMNLKFNEIKEEDRGREVLWRWEPHQVLIFSPDLFPFVFFFPPLLIPPSPFLKVDCSLLSCRLLSNSYVCFLFLF
ncbi:hypothetical protein KSP39_PZI017247 [Platanthera zijinensis]|uniref:Uncharacterized protein n=1 Tax=Platanthera zijinensis TaxID=2320716 RepID=A0AAP0G066_9ASPA